MENTLKDQIIEYIEDELAKRSIFAKVVKCNVRDETSMMMETDSFNTTPSLFKKIVVRASVNLQEKKERAGTYDVSIFLHCCFDLYDGGGSNGVDLTSLSAIYCSSDDYFRRIRR